MNADMIHQSKQGRMPSFRPLVQGPSDMHSTEDPVYTITAKTAPRSGPTDWTWFCPNMHSDCRSQPCKVNSPLLEHIASCHGPWRVINWLWCHGCITEHAWGTQQLRALLSDRANKSISSHVPCNAKIAKGSDITMMWPSLHAPILVLFCKSSRNSWPKFSFCECKYLFWIEIVGPLNTEFE